MALNIRNPDADDLARALAELTGETKTGAVTQALRERLDRVRRRRARDRRTGELAEIGRHCAALPVLDAREADEILGYDDRGVPG